MPAPRTTALLHSSRDADEDAAVAFAALRPLCAPLLQLRHDGPALAAALAALRPVLSSAPPRGLARCFDYVMLPLALMLDSAVAARSGAGDSGASAGQGGPAVPGMRSDAAAEGALSCVLTLLQRAGPDAAEADQAAQLLQRVAALLQLPPGAAAEEVRMPSCAQHAKQRACVHDIVVIAHV
jgi:hypothetical protein